MPGQQKEGSGPMGAVLVEMPRLVDADALMEALAARGLRAELVYVDGSWGIEITSAPEESERVMTELSGLLDAWLAEHELPFIPMRVGERAFTVRPPAD